MKTQYSPTKKVLRLKKPILPDVYSNTASLPNPEVSPLYKLLLVESGTLSLTTQDHTVSLTNGECYLLLPNTQYRLLPSEEPFVAMALSFDCSGNILNSIHGKTVLTAEDLHLSSCIFNEIRNAYGIDANQKLLPLVSPVFGAPQLMETFVEALLINLIRKQIETQPDLILNSTPSDASKHCVDEILSILENNVYQSLTLNDVQKHLFYSKTYLNGVFKKAKGTSIMSYYRYLKIEEAKKLIRLGEKIVDVSDKLHFDTPNYFHKVFKDATGMTPTEYKQTPSTPTTDDTE